MITLISSQKSPKPNIFAPSVVQLLRMRKSQTVFEQHFEIQVMVLLGCSNAIVLTLFASLIHPPVFHVYIFFASLFAVCLLKDNYTGSSRGGSLTSWSENVPYKNLSNSFKLHKYLSQCQGFFKLNELFLTNFSTSHGFKVFYYNSTRDGGTTLQDY